MPNDLATQTEPEAAKLAVPLLERMDPAIGETTSVLGAIMTEFLRRTLRGGVLQIKEAAKRVGDSAHAEVNQRVEELHERSRQSYAQVHEHLDRLQEEQRHRKADHQALKAEIQKLANLLRLANDRLAELEKPR